MKSGFLMCFTAMMFAVLASPLSLAAQDNQDLPSPFAVVRLNRTLGSHPAVGEAL
jgi:hypothetical protein